MWYILDWSYWNTKEEVLTETAGVGKAKILHSVTTGNWGRIRVCPSASREHLVPPIGTQPEEKKGEREWNHVSQGKWSLKPEKKTWNGNESWVQVWEVMSFRKMNVVLSSPGLQNLEIIKNTRFSIIWRHFVSIRVSYNAMAASGGNESSVTREFRHDFPGTLQRGSNNHLVIGLEGF